jgi:hypothetical protein
MLHFHTRILDADTKWFEITWLMESGWEIVETDGNLVVLSLEV